MNDKMHSKAKRFLFPLIFSLNMMGCSRGENIHISDMNNIRPLPEPCFSSCELTFHRALKHTWLCFAVETLHGGLDISTVLHHTMDVKNTTI